MKPGWQSSTVLVFVGVLVVPVVLSGCDELSSPNRARARASAEAQPNRPKAHVARGPVSDGWLVTRVVDGDTIDVTSGGRTLTVRLIGIDTPETVHPTEPVECFGPEASAWTSRQLLSEEVFLEFDPSQGRTDIYDRTLAYVWVEQGQSTQLFNEASVRRGYAREYTYDEAYEWQRALRNAEAAARANSRGLWDRC